MLWAKLRVYSNTHRLSRLPVPVKSGNSVICEAPFKVLGEICECYTEKILEWGPFYYDFFFQAVAFIWSLHQYYGLGGGDI